MKKHIKKKELIPINSQKKNNNIKLFEKINNIIDKENKFKSKKNFIFFVLSDIYQIVKKFTKNVISTVTAANIHDKLLNSKFSKSK